MTPLNASLARTASSITGIDPKVFDAVAQNGHVEAGLLAVFVPAALIGSPWWRWVGIAAGLALLLLWAGVKEFWYDYRYESTEVRGSSLKDFVFYMVGGIVGLAIFGVSQL